MGIDYSANVAIGIEITEDMVKRFIENGLFPEEAYDKDEETALGKIGLEVYCYRSASSGERSYCYVVDGTTLNEVNANVDSFIETLRAYCVNITVDDLKYVGGLYVW